MFSDRTVSLNCVAASVFWVLTLLLIAIGSIVTITADGHVGTAVGASLMVHGLAASACAATLTIRHGLRQQARMVRDAYEMGQDSTHLRRAR